MVPGVQRFCRCKQCLKLETCIKAHLRDSVWDLAKDHRGDASDHGRRANLARSRDLRHLEYAPAPLADARSNLHAIAREAAEDVDSSR